MSNDFIEYQRELEALRQKVEELEQANRIKDEFLAIVAHELRRPMSAIIGWSELLLTGELDEATRVHALETIEQSAKSQNHLIEDLLDLARLGRGKMNLNREPINLVSVIDSAIKTVGLEADRKGIQLESRLDASGGEILGDFNRLQQVIWNLLSNAIKFTPEGGRIEVKLSAVTGKGEEFQRGNSRWAMPYAQIEVSDTGKGISTEFLPYVFESFYQADRASTRSKTGVGLGLAIARQLVELHGGTIEVASEGEGKGATFTVKIPLHRSAEKPAVVPESSSLRPAVSGVRVLVVDDDIDTCDLLIALLEQYGLEVKAVTSAAEALKVRSRWKPNVLVSDIGMPGEDGYTLIRKWRVLESEDGARIPVVALTAYSREEESQKVLEAGFQKHIQKPLDPDELVGAIAALLQHPEKERCEASQLRSGISNNLNLLKSYVAYYVSRDRRIISPLKGAIAFEGRVYAYQGYHVNFQYFWQQIEQRRDFRQLYLEEDIHCFGDFLSGNYTVSECARCNLPIPQAEGQAWIMPNCTPCDDRCEWEKTNTTPEADDLNQQGIYTHILALGQPPTDAPNLEKLLASNRFKVKFVPTLADLTPQLLLPAIDLVLIQATVSEAEAKAWAVALRRYPQLQAVPIIALSPECSDCLPWIDRSLGVEDYLLTPLGGDRLAAVLTRKLQQVSSNSAELYWFPR